jgi:hypothetical protein
MIATSLLWWSAFHRTINWRNAHHAVAVGNEDLADKLRQATDLDA